MRKFVFTISIWMPLLAHAELVSLPIGQFSTGQLDGWQEKTFDGKTDYSLVSDGNTTSKILKASSQHGASGLFYKKKIDIKATPWLHWSWHSESLFESMPETQKSGDDFVARIYVVKDGGLFFWKTLALNYVWSAAHQSGEVWDNPYTGNAQMLAVSDASSTTGTWHHHKRNVAEDFQRVFGEQFDSIDGIALMTDTDNSGKQAITYYGDIFFTSE